MAISSGNFESLNKNGWQIYSGVVEKFHLGPKSWISQPTYMAEKI